MDIYIGSNKINEIYIGTNQINEVYIGSNQVWSRTLYLPTTGWNSTSGISTSEEGANYTNSVTMSRDATLKVTISGSASGLYNFAGMDVKNSSSSSWPGSGTTPHKWGFGGLSYGSQKTINVYENNVIRFYGWIAQNGTGIDVTVTVVNGADNSTLDTFDIDHFDSVSGGGGGTCFLESSLITLHDLTTKRIVEIEAGDLVLGSDGVINEVIELRTIDEGERALFRINDLVTTAAHPIKTTEGWKAIDPVAAMDLHPEMTITILEVGDTLIRVDNLGNEYQEEVSVISLEITSDPVYNLNVSGSDTPEIDGNDTYVVDGVVVHNK